MNTKIVIFRTLESQKSDIEIEKKENILLREKIDDVHTYIRVLKYSTVNYFIYKIIYIILILG